LSKHEEQVLEGLEKEVKAVKKARETLGDNAPTFGGSGRSGNRDWDRDKQGGGGGGGGVLGKRRRGGPHDDWTSSDEDVAEDVRSIPMPRDTPPPIPKEVLDEWYAKRRARRAAEQQDKNPDQGGWFERTEKDIPRENKPVVEAKTVYSAAPVTRDLRKEAVAAFVPTAVQMKMHKGKGQGGLIEPEEADRLEQEGYMKTAPSGLDRPSQSVTMEEVEDEEG
jgi:hypothetical protein